MGKVKLLIGIFCIIIMIISAGCMLPTEIPLPDSVKQEASMLSRADAISFIKHQKMFISPRIRSWLPDVSDTGLTIRGDYDGKPNVTAKYSDCYFVFAEFTTFKRTGIVTATTNNFKCIWVSTEGAKVLNNWSFEDASRPQKLAAALLALGVKQTTLKEMEDMWAKANE